MKRTDTPHRWLIPLTFLISAIVFYFSALPLLDDPDVPWHIAAGTLMWQTHQVPHTDPWAFTSQGTTPWYLLSWVWDVVLGGVDKIGGAFGVYVFAVAVSAGLVAFTAARLLALGVAFPAIMLTLMLAGLGLLEFVSARPHLAGYVLVLVFQALLHKSRDEKEYGKLLWLPPLMLLWVNTHGSFIAGFIVLGAYVAEAFWKKNRLWLRRLMVISLACAVCALINPYGPDVMLGAMRTLGGEAKQYTVEWLPFTFSVSAGLSAWLVVFVLASNLRISAVPLADKLLAMAWMVAMLFTVRNGAIFILLAAPYLAMCIDQQTKDLRETRKPSPFMNFMAKQPVRRVWLATIAASIVCVATAASLPHEERLQSEGISAADAIDYAMEHHPTRRFLTDFNLGGQVIYRTQGKLPMFMDSRAATAYTPEEMADYIDFMWQRPGWEQKIKARGVQGMLIANNMKFNASYDRRQWKLVFAGKAASVYIRLP